MGYTHESPGNYVNMYMTLATPVGIPQIDRPMVGLFPCLAYSPSNRELGKSIYFVGAVGIKIAYNAGIKYFFVGGGEDSAGQYT